MSKVDRLVRSYAKFCALPWERAMAGPQRVWFVVYDPRDERRMRARMPEFALVTEQAPDGAFPAWEGEGARDAVASTLDGLVALCRLA